MIGIKSDPPEKRVGFAVMGLGRLALENILPAFAQAKHAKLTGFMSGNPSKDGDGGGPLRDRARILLQLRAAVSAQVRQGHRSGVCGLAPRWPLQIPPLDSVVIA